MAMTPLMLISNDAVATLRGTGSGVIAASSKFLGSGIETRGDRLGDIQNALAG